MGKLFEKLKKHNEALSHFKRAIELNPNNIEALTFTGVAFQKLGQLEAAAAAFNDVLVIDPENAQATFLLATVQDTAPPAKPDSDYVKRLFDEFADTFDKSLTDVEYNAPEQLIELAKQFSPNANADQDILDIGCGTGLTGLKFKPLAKTLKGIDISPRMLSAAKERGIYDELEENEIITALVRHQNDTDIIVSADTFPYLGDLESVFLSVASALRDNGLFLFTVETHSSDEDYLLGQTARYSHSRQYINDLAKRREFKVLACNDTVYRKESGNDVNGLIVALRNI
jgi:predicted TPR repeat methyltransferase